MSWQDPEAANEAARYASPIPSRLLIGQILAQHVMSHGELVQHFDLVEPDAIEAISERFGKNLVTLGIANNKEATWHMNQNLRSPSYLTKWSDLPRVG